MSWTGLNWRDTGRTMKLGPVDARVLPLLLIFLYHWALWTFALCVIGVIILAVIEFRGYSIPNAMRRLSAWLVGPHRPAVSSRRLGRSDR